METTVQWLDEEAWDGDLERRWSDLIDRCPTASIFQTPEWVSSWWKHFGSGRLLILAVSRGGRLVGLAPFVQSSRARLGLRFTRLALAGEPHADHLGVLVDPADPDALGCAVRAILERSRTVDVLRLAEITMDGFEEQALLAEAARTGADVSRRVWSRSPVLRLDRPWDEIEGAYPRALRTRLNRARNRQKRDGGLVFQRWQPGVDELPPLLEGFRALEDRTWKGESRVGIFSTRESRDFFLELSGKFARRGWLDVATLASNDSLVAYRYGFRFRGVFLDYNLAHDPAHDRLAPGRTLLDDIIRDSHRIGLRAVDASRGKIHPPHLLADWTDDSRWHSLVLLFGPGARGRALSWVEKQGKPLARRLLRRGEAPGAGRVEARRPS